MISSWSTYLPDNSGGIKMSIKDELKRRYEEQQRGTSSVPVSNNANIQKSTSMAEQLKSRYESSNGIEKREPIKNNINTTEVARKNYVNPNYNNRSSVQSKKNESKKNTSSSSLSFSSMPSIPTVSQKHTYAKTNGAISLTDESMDKLNEEGRRISSFEDMELGEYGKYLGSSDFNSYVQKGVDSHDDYNFFEKKMKEIPLIGGLVDDSSYNRVVAENRPMKYGPTNDMTEEEKNIYNYLFGKEGKEVADIFYDKWKTNQGLKKKVERQQDWYDFAENNPVIGNALAFTAPIMTAPFGMLTRGAEVLGGDVNAGSLSSLGSDMRTGISESVTKDMNGVGKFFYSTAQSAADVAGSIFAGSPVLFQGFLAGNEMINDAKARGGKDSQALLEGAIGALAGGILSKFGVEKSILSGALKNSGKGAAKLFLTEIGKNFIKEGAEEGVENIVNGIADYMIMGDKSKFNLTYNDYLGKGSDEKEAFNNTLIDFAKETGLEALAGGIVGSSIGGINAANFYGNTTKLGSKISDQNYSEYVEGIDNEASQEGYEAYKYAMKLAEEQEQGKKVSNYQKGLMDTLVDNAINSATVANEEVNNTENREEKQSQVDYTTEERETVNTRSAFLNNEDVTIKKISKVENGEAYIDIVKPDGTKDTVKASEVTFDNDSTQMIFENAEKFGTAGANAYTLNYKGQTSMEYYDTAFKAYYDGGMTNTSMDTIKEQYPVIESLSDTMQYAYNSGITDSQNNLVKLPNSTENVQANKYTGLIKNVASRSLNGVDRGVINLYAKELGVSVEVVQGADGINGANVNGRIIISDKASNPGLVVFTHEVTHEFEKRAPKEYKAYRDYVINYFKTSNLEAYTKRKTYLENLYKQRGVKLTEEGLMNEMAANATEEFLTDANRISDIINSDRTIAQKLFDIIKKIADKLKKTYENYNPKSAEAKMIKKDLDVFENARKLWDEAFTASKKSNVSSENSTEYSIIEKDKNEPVNMPYVRNYKNKTAYYGDTYGQSIEPAGEYMLNDTLNKKATIPGFEYGDIEFKNPLYVEFESTGMDGWKKVVSEKFGGKTGKKLSDAIIKAGYDAIITVDEDGTYNEIVNLKGEKSDFIRYSLKEGTDIDAEQLTKENELLKNINQIFVEQIQKSTADISQSEIDKISKFILKKYNSDYDASMLSEKITSLYDYLKENGSNVTDVIEIASYIGNIVASRSMYMDTTVRDANKPILDHIKKYAIKISDADKSSLDSEGGYDTFRKKYFGKIRLTKSGTPVDAMYQELVSLYPGSFDEKITNQADMLIEIANFIDNSKSSYSYVKGNDADIASAIIAVDVIREYLNKSSMSEEVKREIENQSTEITELYTDRELLANAFLEVAKTEEERQRVMNYQENVDKLNDKSTVLRMLKNQLKELMFSPGPRDNEKIEILKKKIKSTENSIQYYDKQLISLEASKPIRDVMYRERNRAKQRQNEYNKKANQTAKDERVKREYREKITKKSLEISKWLLSGDDKKHVPEKMRALTAEFLKSIDFSTGRLNSYGEPTKRSRLWEKLSNEYDNIAKGTPSSADSDGVYIELDPDFVDRFKGFNEATENKKLEDMSSEELTELYELISIMRKSIVDANKLHLANRNQTVTDISNGFFTENSDKKTKNERPGITQKIDDMLNIGMLDSFSYFDMLGPTMKQFYHDSIRKGFDSKIRNTKVAADYITNLLGDTDVYKEGWTGKKARTTKFTVSGGDIELTPAQVMSLYVQNKREQARGHIYNGGIKQAPVIAESDFKVGMLSFKKSAIKKSFSPVKIGESEVKSITDTLTTEQKRIADGIVNFFTSTTSEWGNEVSMELYGYKKFKESNYFPIVSDSNYILTKDGDTTNPIATLKNMGSTKQTVKGANNPIIIEDIFDVYTRQADQMGSYNAFVVPLSDLQKIYNVKSSKEGVSVKQTLERVFGNEGKNYIHNLMIDINGSAKQGIGTELSNRLLSNMKAASVGANLRVAIQQPTAIFRSFTEINPKYVLKAMAHKGDFKKAKEYAPIAQWKDWGFFEMDTGRQMKDIFLGTHGLATIKEKSMILAQKADNITWGKLWKACEYETEDTTDFEKGSEEFYQHCADRFSQLIDRTQVVDSVLHRTQIMRSKDLLMKMSTSFMSEPMKSYNLLKSAAYKAFTQKDSKSKTYFVRCVATFTLTSLATALASSFVDAMRDDEDKEFLDKYTDNVIGSFFDNVNPINMIPIIKETTSILQGFTPSRAELSGVVDVINAGRNMYKYFEGTSRKSLYDCVEGVVTSSSKLFGLPLKNAVRDTKAIFNNAKEIIGDSAEDTDIPSVYEDVKKKNDITKKDADGSFNSSVSTAYYDALYEAYKVNDTALYDTILRDLVQSGRKLSSVKTALHNRIRKELAENETLIKMAKAKTAKDSTTYYAARKELTNKKYTVDDINAAIEIYLNK